MKEFLNQEIKPRDYGAGRQYGNYTNLEPFTTKEELNAQPCNPWRETSGLLEAVDPTMWGRHT